MHLLLYGVHDQEVLGGALATPPSSSSPALVIVPRVRHCEGVLTNVLTLLLCREHVVGVRIRTVRPQERFTFPGSSMVKVEYNRGDLPGGSAAVLDRGNVCAVCIKTYQCQRIEQYT